MKVFSFRAEWTIDIAEFRALLKRRGYSSSSYECTEVLLPMGESGAELTIDLSLEQLRSLMRQQQGSHVMIQTLREVPLNENSLVRDHTIPF
jgi:hypothetical protein